MKRMLTGARPTGDLHLGHYVGTIQNWVKLHKQFDTYILVADWHMLTTKNSKEDIAKISQNARKLVLDSIACGIEPEHVKFYLQSAVPEVAEYNLLLQSLVPVAELKRIPSLKEMAQSDDYDSMNFALLGYPILQSADILAIGASVVPVGKDNMAHVELTRRIAQRFNSKYGESSLIKPEIITSETPSLVGIDGKNKMSKSLGNSIALNATSSEVNKAVQKMYTDPNRIHADIPGTVEGNPLFIYHNIFNPNRADIADMESRYRAGKISDAEVKDKLKIAINNFLEPIRERRAMFENDSGLIDEILFNGTNATRELVKKNLYDLKKQMGLAAAWNSIRRKAEKQLENQR